MNTPPCWICGQPADSAEHMVKASDVRSLFGKVTQNNRLFGHSDHELNTPIKGPNADPLKFRPSLCERCNNARSQPHDRAWERLSHYLRSDQITIKRGLRLTLNEVFGSDDPAHLLNVHSYFLKLLGCYAVEYKVPLPLQAFAVALLSGLPHPHVYISLFAMPSAGTKPEIVVGELRAVHDRGRLVGATWYYTVGVIGVAIAYQERGRPKSGNAWHPDDGLTIVTLA